MRVSPAVRRFLAGAASDPSVRARFLTEVEGRPATAAPVRAALREIGRKGWAATLLASQFPDGHWATPGTKANDLYLPKYIVTNWLAILLADLGLTRRDPRIRRTAELILDRWGASGGPLGPTGDEICITGNATRALIRFGYLDEAPVQNGIAYIVRTQKSDGGWHCAPSRHGTLDGWEGLAALAEIPERERDEAVRRSIERGAEFFLRARLMNEGPVRYAPWFRIHYPNHYFYDVLVGLRLLTRLGYGADPRLGPALRWLEGKRAADGTWALEAVHPDLDPETGGYPLRRPAFGLVLEVLGRPSRWATVEALSVRSRVERARAG